MLTIATYDSDDMHQGRHARRSGFPSFVTLLGLITALALAWRAGTLGALGRELGLAAAPRPGQEALGVAAANGGELVALPSGSPAAPQPAPPVHLTLAQREGAALARLAALGVPIYCGGPSKPFVALTFDDGPGPYTPQTLAILRAYGDTATFFLVGKELQAYPALLDVPAEEGRLGEVGDHTWNHVHLPRLSLSDLQHEIGDTQQAVAEASRSPVLVFRPPYGARNPAIDGYVASLGMVEIIWTVDSGDSGGATAAQVLANVVSGLRPGSIILLHENRGTTLSDLPQILQAVRDRGLRTVTLSTLLTFDPPTKAQLRHPGDCPG